MPTPASLIEAIADELGVDPDTVVLSSNEVTDDLVVTIKGALADEDLFDEDESADLDGAEPT